MATPSTVVGFNGSPRTRSTWSGVENQTRWEAVALRHAINALIRRETAPNRSHSVMMDRPLGECWDGWFVDEIRGGVIDFGQSSFLKWMQPDAVASNDLINASLLAIQRVAKEKAAIMALRGLDEEPFEFAARLLTKKGGLAMLNPHEVEAAQTAAFRSAAGMVLKAANAKVRFIVVPFLVRSHYHLVVADCSHGTLLHGDGLGKVDGDIPDGVFDSVLLFLKIARPNQTFAVDPSKNLMTDILRYYPQEDGVSCGFYLVATVRDLVAQGALVEGPSPKRPTPRQEMIAGWKRLFLKNYFKAADLVHTAPFTDQIYGREVIANAITVRLSSGEQCPPQYHPLTVPVQEGPSTSVETMSKDEIFDFERQTCRIRYRGSVKNAMRLFEVVEERTGRERVPRRSVSDKNKQKKVSFPADDVPLPPCDTGLDKVNWQEAPDLDPSSVESRKNYCEFLLNSGYTGCPVNWVQIQQYPRVTVTTRATRATRSAGRQQRRTAANRNTRTAARSTVVQVLPKGNTGVQHHTESTEARPPTTGDHSRVSPASATAPLPANVATPVPLPAHDAGADHGHIQADTGSSRDSIDPAIAKTARSRAREVEESSSSGGSSAPGVTGNAVPPSGTGRVSQSSSGGQPHSSHSTRGVVGETQRPARYFNSGLQPEPVGQVATPSVDNLGGKVATSPTLPGTQPTKDSVGRDGAEVGATTVSETPASPRSTDSFKAGRLYQIEDFDSWLADLSEKECPYRSTRTRGAGRLAVGHHAAKADVKVDWVKDYVCFFGRRLRRDRDLTKGPWTGCKRNFAVRKLGSGGYEVTFSGVHNHSTTGDVPMGDRHRTAYDRALAVVSRFADDAVTLRQAGLFALARKVDELRVLCREHIGDEDTGTQLQAGPSGGRPDQLHRSSKDNGRSSEQGNGSDENWSGTEKHGTHTAGQGGQPITTRITRSAIGRKRDRDDATDEATNRSSAADEGATAPSAHPDNEVRARRRRRIPVSKE